MFFQLTKSHITVYLNKFHFWGMFVFAIIYGGAITFIINGQMKTNSGPLHYCRQFATDGTCIATDLATAFTTHAHVGLVLYLTLSIPIVVLISIINIIKKTWSSPDKVAIFFVFKVNYLIFIIIFILALYVAVINPATSSYLRYTWYGQLLFFYIYLFLFISMYGVVSFIYCYIVNRYLKGKH